jgi:hypothetical protein
MPSVTSIFATIPQGESLTDPIDLTGGQLVRVYMPEEWNHAPLTLRVSSDGVQAYRDVFMGDGQELQFTVVPNAAVLVPDDKGKGLAFVKFRSGTRDQPVLQNTARTFELILQTGGPYATSLPTRRRSKAE